jgi:hypothetical protein
MSDEHKSIIDKIRRVAKLKRELNRLADESREVGAEINKLLDTLTDEDREMAEKILDLMRQSRVLTAQHALAALDLNAVMNEVFVHLDGVKP